MDEPRAKNGRRLSEAALRPLDSPLVQKRDGKYREVVTEEEEEEEDDELPIPNDLSLEIELSNLNATYELEMSRHNATMADFPPTNSNSNSPTASLSSFLNERLSESGSESELVSSPSLPPKPSASSPPLPLPLPPPLPLPLPPPSPSRNTSSSSSHNEIMEEHDIFLKAAFQLLNERETLPPPSSSTKNTPQKTIKAGTLKKCSAAHKSITTFWKTKYVVVTPGLFTYHDDIADTTAALESTSKPKVIPLQVTSQTICRAVKLPFSPLPLSTSHSASVRSRTAAAFEISTTIPFQSQSQSQSQQQTQRKLFMVNSPEERSSWIRAIHLATLGQQHANARSFDHFHHVESTKLTPATWPDLKIFQSVQHGLKNARDKKKYLQVMSGGFKFGRRNLRIPIFWIRENCETEQNRLDQATLFHEGNVSKGVSQLYKDMSRDSVRLNNVLIVGGGDEGGDKGENGNGSSVSLIVGALTREILQADRKANLNNNEGVGNKETKITEVSGAERSEATSKLVKFGWFEMA